MPAKTGASWEDMAGDFTIVYHATTATVFPYVIGASTSNIFAVLPNFQQAPRPQATAAPSRSSVESIPNATQFTNDIIADEKK